MTLKDFRAKLNLTTDITIYDNYKTWIVMQISEPPGFARDKRAQTLQDKSQKKKQRHN